MGVLVRERIVRAGVRVDLWVLRAKARKLVPRGHLQHLHEDKDELLAEAVTETGQGVVVRVLVAGKEAEGRPTNRNSPARFCGSNGPRSQSRRSVATVAVRGGGVATAVRAGASSDNRSNPSTASIR